MMLNRVATKKIGDTTPCRAFPWIKTAHIPPFLIAIGLLILTAAASAQTLIPGTLPSDEDLAGVRYQSFKSVGSDKKVELYLGIPDLDLSDRRVEQNAVVWVEGDNQVIFTYDRGQDRLLTTITNSAGQATLEYPLYTAQVLALGNGVFTPADLNRLTISLVDNDANGGLELRNLVLDEQPLGDLIGVGDWTVDDYCFGEGFVLGATLSLSGNFSNDADKSTLQFTDVVVCEFYHNCGKIMGF